MGHVKQVIKVRVKKVSAPYKTCSKCGGTGRVKK